MRRPTACSAGADRLGRYASDRFLTYCVRQRTEAPNNQCPLQSAAMPQGLRARISRLGSSPLKMTGLVRQPGQSKAAADKVVKGIRCKTRKHYSVEENIRVVLAGLRGEECTASLCPRIQTLAHCQGLKSGLIVRIFRLSDPKLAC